jgi:hypothetical protein
MDEVDARFRHLGPLRRTLGINGKDAPAPPAPGFCLRPISSVRLPRAARSLSLSRRVASRDRVGDDARVRSGSSTAGADLRFARPVGAIGTCEING